MAYKIREYTVIYDQMHKCYLITEKYRTNTPAVMFSVLSSEKLLADRIVRLLNEYEEDYGYRLHLQNLEYKHKKIAEEENVKLPEGPQTLFYEGVVVGTAEYRQDPDDETVIIIDAKINKNTAISEFLKNGKENFYPIVSRDNGVEITVIEPPEEENDEQISEVVSEESDS